MASVSAATSQKIKNMSIVCAILVVVIHVDWPHDRICTAWFIHQAIANGLSTIAVPFFFIVSGYFLSAHFSEVGWYKREVTKRIRSLFVPFVIWTAISVFFPIIADILANRPFGTAIGLYNGEWVMTCGLDLRDGPTFLGSLWYVRCLLLFVLLSPAFNLMIGRLGFRWLVVTFALTLFHRSTSWTDYSALYKIFNYGFSLEGVFYFSVGIYLQSLHELRPMSKCVRYASVIVALGLVSLNTLLHYCKIKSPVSVIALAIPFMLYSVWNLMPDARWPTWFTNSSFPLFVSHWLIIRCLADLVKHSPLQGTTVGSCVVFVAGIVASLAITRFISHAMPRTARLLFAGRS